MNETEKGVRYLQENHYQISR